MSQAIILIRDLILCPECIKKNKVRRFKTDKDLNIHLKMKHDSNYKVSLAGGSASFMLRSKN